jgi:hypothetical protein
VKSDFEEIMTGDGETFGQQKVDFGGKTQGLEKEGEIQCVFYLEETTP